MDQWKALPVLCESEALGSWTWWSSGPPLLPTTHISKTKRIIIKHSPNHHKVDFGKVWAYNTCHAVGAMDEEHTC